MYIEPNSTIKILHNVPLDPTYDHTIYFETLEAQQLYFNGLAKYTLNNQTYQRVQRGYMRIAIKAENLYDCNYLMFQNTSFGTKWFYAFITAVEYVNNEVSQVEFQIDDMQTWHFNYDVERCFVEREHSATDDIGDNLVPESFELGDYVSDDLIRTGHLSSKKIVVAATCDKNLNDSGGGLYGGIYSGLEYNVFNTAQEAANFINTVEASPKAGAIVSIFYAPSEFITGSGYPTVGMDWSTGKNNSSIGGYVPKNKKLFTYPFNFLYVSNMQGNFATYRYEYFSGDRCTFRLTGDFVSDPTIAMIPKNYKGIGTNYDELITLSGFPKCAWKGDTFMAYAAMQATVMPFQNMSQIVNNTVNLAGSVGLGAISGGVAGGTAGATAGATNAGLSGSVEALIPQLVPVMNAIRAVPGLVQASAMPDHAHGAMARTTMAAINALDFIIMRKHIRREMAEIIDNFFNMYGYATHRCKVPNRNIRRYWNYVKTIGCTITGSIPADAATHICQIYDHGITFWLNGNNVGHYELDNIIR